MVSLEISHSIASSSPMAKPAVRTRVSSLISDATLFAGGAASAILIMWALSSFTIPNPNFSRLAADSSAGPNAISAQDCAAGPATFYDDPNLSYSVGEPVRDWDKRRREWLEIHRPLEGERILMLTGSQPAPCRNPIGDHLLLRSFKNKVDYCRIQRCDVFYNDALLHPKMTSFWAKIPVVRAAMLAHPEAEWIWWVDSDAIITDMEFKLPLQRYAQHNLVVHGWAHLVYEERSWTSLNAGVFLIRNCEWSMEFLEVWAEMGPQSPNFFRWGRVQRSTFKDKLFPGSDDQAALIYLLLKQKERWADKIYLEGEYLFQSYWVEIMKGLANTTARYAEMERAVGRLRRRRAEVEVGRCYSALRDQYLRREGVGFVQGGWRRPFVTHFTGCQPCSGNHNPTYSGESCWRGMKRALDFADDQVLRSYGFAHSGSPVSSSVSPLPFDYPA